MAARKLSSRFPTLVINKFKDLEDAYRRTRDALDPINRWIIQAIKATNEHADRLTPTEGAVAPTSTPTDVGLFYLDTVLKDMYMSVGTASSADWKKITP